MKSNPVIAKYAVALFNIALDRKVVDVVSERLSVLGELFASSPDIMGYFLNPSVTKNVKLDLIKKVLPNDAVSEMMLLFCDILIKKGRFTLFSEIADEYDSYRKTFKNEKDVTILSAFPMSLDAQQSLKKALEAQLSSSVNLCLHEDASLIGGAILEIDGIVYDGSVQGRIKRIHSALRGE